MLLSYYGKDVPPPSPPPLTKDEELATFRKYKRSHRSKDRETLLRQYLCWAFDLAAKFQGPRLDFDEAISVANLGLREALEGFNPEKGFRFTTYAAFVVRRRLIEALVNTYPVKVSDHVRKKWKNLEVSAEDLALQLVDNEPRTAEEFFERLGETSETDLAGTENAVGAEDSPAEALETSSLSDELKKAVSKLPRLEREAIRSRHYRETRESYESLGLRLGVSKQRAKKAYEEALVKLKEHFKKE